MHESYKELAAAGLERTYEELKLNTTFNMDIRRTCLERTYEELKRVLGNPRWWEKETRLERTYEELKLLLC